MSESTADDNLLARNGSPWAALLSYGFRPFFLLAGIYAALSAPAWLLLYYGGVSFSPALPPLLWHGHEMLFGFAVAGLAGFMLTAVPSWTGSPPVRGGNLAALMILWLCGRVLAWLPYPLPFAIVDVLFLPALGLAVGFVLARRTGPRNQIFLAILAALTAANLVVHLDAAGVLEDAGAAALRFTLGVFALLITIVGGRIVPAFTANALKRRGRDSAFVQRPWLDRLAIACVAATALAELFVPSGALIVALAGAAALLNGARLAGWNGLKTLDDPLVWVLHLGYAWLVVGFALKAAAAAGLAPETATLHALGVGAVGTMIMAVMTRAALGHTGRALKAAPATTLAYVLLLVAASSRIAASFLPEHGLWLLALAAAAWTGAFLLFLLVYAPILVQPRARAA